MSLKNVNAGKKLPEEFNVVIEIPQNHDPVKYEVDKETGAVFVDRFLATPMFYPCNYGYIPETLSEDGDPVDVLVISPCPVAIGSVIPCRPLGVLMMEDEKGVDAKLLAVPTSKLYPDYDHMKDIDDVHEGIKGRIKHFFEHYKDREPGKWVKVTDWRGLEAARKEVMDSAERYNKA